MTSPARPLGVAAVSAPMRMRCQIPEALGRGVFGWNGSRLCGEYSADECARAIQQISADPANANPDHASGKSIYLLTSAARKRIDALSWAIFYHKQTATKVQP